MKKGQKIYYSPSLYEKAIPGKILDIQYFAGRPAWLTMQTKTGEIISDYESKFATSKPVQFNYNPENYSKTYLNRMDNSIVSLRELRISFEKFHAHEKSFAEYMHELTGSGCFVPVND